MSTTLSKFYRIQNDSKIKLRITIGYGQKGTTIVHLDNIKLADNKEDSFELDLPGIGSELNNKTLVCTTTVADIQPETNETSVTYELIGGAKPFKETLQESVDEDNGVKFYTATFYFYL